MEDVRRHNNPNPFILKNPDSVNHHFYKSKINNLNKKVNNIINNKNTHKSNSKEVITSLKRKI